MNKLSLKKLIKEEIEKLILETELMLGELLNPDYAFDYIKKSKNHYEYIDSNGVTFFVKATYQPIKWDKDNEGYFEFKTGWIDENDKPIYEPSTPPYGDKRSSAIDLDKRADTVAKIYKDEILPFFEKQQLSNIMVIKPISLSRRRFAEMLVNKFTPLDKFKISYEGTMIIIEKNELIS